MSDTKIDAYATHLPVLELIQKQVAPETVLEFGTGRYSTEHFAKHAKRLWSVEEKDHTWHEMAQTAYKDAKHAEFFFVPKAKVLEWYTEICGDLNPDLVFIDGDQVTRAPLIAASFDRTDLIVAHDTQAVSTYNYDTITVPKGWHTATYLAVRPWTSVWTKDAKLAAAVAALNKQSTRPKKGRSKED